jgi:prepilin peptidase CpaA
MLLFSHAAVSHTATLGLIVTVLVAAWHDWFSWRIPNRMLAASAAAALMLALFAPGAIGLAASLQGALTGFLIFLPLYMLGGMAAGDVKLLATLGLFAGPMLTVDIAVYSFFAGGVWAVLFLLAQTDTGMLLGLKLKSLAGERIAHYFTQPAPPPNLKIAQSKGVIPYGVVIACGTLAALTLVPL